MENGKSHLRYWFNTINLVVILCYIDKYSGEGSLEWENYILPMGLYLRFDCILFYIITYRALEFISVIDYTLPEAIYPLYHCNLNNINCYPHTAVVGLPI
jgi:hypothetical protein